MISRGRGSIVNIGSATGKAALPGRTAYAATKLALLGITRTLAVEAGPYGVRVNLVSPANVDGDRLRWVLASRAKTENVPIADVEARMTSQAALKRFVSAEEVAKTVAFLASDDAAAITGEDINVSAGYVMY
jgi:NAD(P)-dependent dehydrogenase (short-subunit alcohol dehydrogenase family)